MVLFRQRLGDVLRGRRTELGLTLALAVLLDATVIRMMLVPSLLGMLGDRAWALPRWLDRRLPHVRFSH